MKTIILVRHAESKNNVDKAEARKACFNLTRCIQLPSYPQWCSLAALCCVPMNTDLSPLGLKMIVAQAERMRSSQLLDTLGIELIVHSHLIRAKRTCFTLFDGSTIRIPTIQHEDFYEKGIMETCRCRKLNHRVEKVTAWLNGRPEKVICLVGHSAFFREFSGQEMGMRNCEISQVTLLPDGSVADFRVLLDGGDKCFA